MNLYKTLPVHLEKAPIGAGLTVPPACRRFRRTGGGGIGVPAPAGLRVPHVITAGIHVPNPEPSRTGCRQAETPVARITRAPSTTPTMSGMSATNVHVRLNACANQPMRAGPSRIPP